MIALTLTDITCEMLQDFSRTISMKIKLTALKSYFIYLFTYLFSQDKSTEAKTKGNYLGHNETMIETI